MIISVLSYVYFSLPPTTLTNLPAVTLLALQVYLFINYIGSPKVSEVLMYERS